MPYGAVHVGHDATGAIRAHTLRWNPRTQTGQRTRKETSMPRVAARRELLHCGRRRIRGRPAMKRLSLLAVLAITGIIAVAMPVAAAAQGSSTNPDPLPLPAGEELLWNVVGEGVQIYDCTPGATDPTTNVWTFRE